MALYCPGSSENLIVHSNMFIKLFSLGDTFVIALTDCVSNCNRNSN